MSDTVHTVDEWPDRDYLTYWHCEPPEMGQPHRVTSQKWEDDYHSRHIYAWEPWTEVLP